MAVNPYGLYDYNPPKEEPQGDRAATAEDFQPEYSKAKLKRLIKLYKQSPGIFKGDRKEKLKKHAIYHNVAFYEGDFSIVEALKQFGGGLLEGFTTLGISDPPDNEYEAIARNVGHLLGFAPGMAIKPLKLLGLNRAARVIGAVGESVPMRVGSYATRKAEKVFKPVMATAFAGRAGASSTAAKFLTGGAASSVVEEGFKLGVASAASNWQQGVDGMIEAGVGGAKFGAAFGVLGNMIPGKGKASYALRATAGSIFQGLPSTQRGATTPEQVYEYLLGAYFGGGATGWIQKGAAKFFVKKEKQAYGSDGKLGDTKLRALNDPELVKGWGELDPEIQKEVKREMLDPDFNGKGKASIHYDDKTVKAGGFQARTAQQELVMTVMGIEPDSPIKSKKAWDKFAAITEGTESLEKKSMGLANQTEKEFNEIFEKRNEVVKELNKEVLGLDKLEGPDRILAKDKIDRLEGDLVDLNKREAELIALEPYQFIDRETNVRHFEEGYNTGNDIGMVSNADLTKKSERFVTEKLADIWDKEGTGVSTKINERVRLTNLVDNVIKQEKFSKKDTRVDTNELIKEIKEAIKKEEGFDVKIGEDTVNDFRQWLTRRNFGRPVQYLNISSNKKGEVVSQELRGEEGFTKAGNRKQSIEPKKKVQEVFEELTGTQEESHLIFDNVTVRGDRGQFSDLSLNGYRKFLKGRGVSQEKADALYDSFIKNMHKTMSKQGLYPFGGKGDNDIIIYMKKHPSLNDGAAKTYINQYLETIFNKGKNREYYNSAIKRNRYFTKNEAKEQYLSNIMWDISLNGFKPKTRTEYREVLDKLFNGKGYIKNATAWNKRQQIWFTPTWKADAEFVKNSYNEYLNKLYVPSAKDKTAPPIEFLNATINGKARYAIVKDLADDLFVIDKNGEKIRIKPLDTSSKNTEYGENVDGMILVEDGYLNTLIKDSGLPESGQSKSFIVSPDAQNGALLGKYMMHSVGKEASRQMREAGLHMIMQESAVKQRGERQITDYKIKNGKIEIEDPNLIYELPIEDVQYGYNVKQSNTMAGYNPDGSVHKHGIPKPLLMAMSQNTFKSFSPKMIEDFYNETIYKRFKGDKDINITFEEYMKSPESTQLLKILEKNIDKLGINQLLRAINETPTQFTDSAYSRLMKVNQENIAQRVAEGDITSKQAEDILNNIAEFNSATDRIIDAATKWSSNEKMVGREGNINPVLMHNYIRPYRFQVVRNYVFQSISRPKVGNSGVARMRGYDKFFREDPKFDILNTRDDVFFLDESFRKMPINSHLGEKYNTLEKLWNATKKGRELHGNKDAKAVLKALTVRVPMDSVSGAQAMEFAGFTGRQGHGILMHSRAMRAEGGADLDGDESFIFFGGRKGSKGDGFRKEWIDKFQENKDEYLAKNGTIPDRKKGFVPGGKMTYEEWLTTQDSKATTGIDPKARDSKMWQYDSQWRQDISTRAVDGRQLLGGTVSMAQILKSAHNSILAMPNKKNTYKIWDSKTKKEQRVTIEARTDKTELSNARQLASSMTAFTSDPLDVAGLTGYADYYSKLGNAYFKVAVNGKKVSLDKDNYFILANKSGIVGQLADINSALFSRDYKNNKAWDAQGIKEKTNSVNNRSGLGLASIRNNMLAKLGKLANSVELYDSPFVSMNYNNLSKMYRQHNEFVNKFPEFKKLLGNLDVPMNGLIKPIMEKEVWRKTNIDKISRNTKAFDNAMKFEGSPFRKGKAWYHEVSGRNKSLVSGNKQKNIDYRVAKLEKLLKFAEDTITQDVSDMVSFRQVYRYYDPVEIGPVLFNKILRKSSQLRRDSYLQKKGINDGEEPLGSIGSTKMFKKGEDAVRRTFGNMVIKGKERSKTLDQAKIDLEIARFKKTLPNARSKKMFDMFMLGTFREGTTETNISKLGMSSNAVENSSVVDYIGDFSTVMNRAMKKIGSDKIFIENLDKGDMVEKDLPVNTILKDTTTGYEGLHSRLSDKDAKRIPANVKQELTELVENLKFYNGKIGQNLNEVVRSVLGKDFNALTYKDFVNLNSYFKELQRGTVWQRLFGDKKKSPIDAKSFEGKENKSKMRAPLLKKRYSIQFPLTINRETMKYDIELMEKRGLFVSKAGEVVEGDMLQPTNFTEKLQHAVVLSMDKAQADGDKEAGILRKALEFIDALPEGEALRRVAVRKLEAEGNVNSLHANKILGKQWAENYLKEYNKEMDEANYIELSDKLFRINRTVGDKVERIEKKGNEIVEDIENVYKNHFEKMFTIIRGKQNSEGVNELLDSYHKVEYGKKQYFDRNGEEPIYNYKKFVKDIYKAYEKGENITTDLGIDGLRAIARSMMITLQHQGTKMTQKQLRKIVPPPEPTGKISEGYWPHMFFDKVLVKKALETSLKTIDESTLSEKDKQLEREKIQWRSKTLTGDWITGTENWDAYEKVSNPNIQKNTDKIIWFKANQMTSSMRQRTSHIPGHSIDATVAETYSRNIYKTYFKQLAQILSRDILQDFDNMAIKKKWHKTDVDYKHGGRSLKDRWSDHYKLYVQDAMGHPSIIPDYMINDPGMKLKGTPYAWWADNKVRDRMNSVAKKLGLEGPVIDGIKREKFTVQDVAHWSNLEAKYELMSLLAHPKSMVNNLFGGTLHTIQSTGATALKKVYDYNFLRTINPKWTNSQAIMDFVISEGVFPDMLANEWGMQKELQSSKTKQFLSDVGKKLNKKGEIEKETYRELAAKHGVTKPILNTAAKFMSVPEMKLRKDAFMAHYIKAWEMFGGAITQHNHPFLIEMAKKGVKATQFLYSAPYRPGFARTALGKVMTRFQLWSWNAARFRNDVMREARIKGYREGTPEYEKFKRTAQIDLLVYSLGSVYAMSLFDLAIPAPLSHFKETSEWLFGDEKERNRAFWGTYPTALAPLQIITPPVTRGPMSLLKSLSNDDYDKFLNYHIYTLFPFGRIARDFSPYAKGNVLDNPYRSVEKFTGIPYGDIQRKRKALKENMPYHPVYNNLDGA
tara:strand:- start:2574 stop:11498 length:8925 start_codon:yes stop_codon:yes gene_type:complete